MTTSLLLLVALQTAIIVAPAPNPAIAAAAPSATVQTYFVLTYSQGPNWIAGQPMQRQRLGDHFRYMQKLQRDGVLVGGGPLVGENAGMAMIAARDLATARAILAVDPAITGGVFTGTVRTWEVRVGGVTPAATQPPVRP